MIALYTRAEARALDDAAVRELGISTLMLMENAGAGACVTLLETMREHLSRVVILGGTGQNGGDGWVLARQLLVRGIPSVPILLGDPASVRGDAATNLAALHALGLEPLVLSPDAVDPLEAVLHDASLIVDGLFGTGLDRPIEGGHARAVELVNGARAPVFALDLPSGIDADTGEILGEAVRAKITATFAGHKRGLHQHPGVDHAGEIVLVPIGTPALASRASAQLFEPEDVARVLEPRPLDIHKGGAGRVLVVAGSPGRTGAAVLAGLGALRAGAGLVTIAARGETRAALDAKALELMTAALADEPALAVADACALAETMDCAVVGPGLGLDAAARSLALGLAEKLSIPTVLDADALSALAQSDAAVLRRAAAARVITPHPGEAARLLGVQIAEVQADRYAAAAELTALTGAVTILKGARTVVAVPGGFERVCRRGSPAMATAGVGDVLAGVVAALLAGHDAAAAAVVAATLHAVAGEIAARSDRGLLAHEVADALPAALERCRDIAETRALTNK